MTDYYDYCIRHPRKAAALIDKLETENKRLRDKAQEEVSHVFDIPDEEFIKALQEKIA